MTAPSDPGVDARLQTLTLTQPDDWHLHLRDGAALQAVLPFTARQFGRAIVMPNLRPPVTTAAQAVAYRQRILAALASSEQDGRQWPFEPLMTLYLTDNTAPDEVKRAREAGVVAFKLYPAGATTNSDAGVTDLLGRCRATLEGMQREGMLLLVHGEVTDAEGGRLGAEDFLLVELADGRRVAVRPSGTEPKVKFYGFARAAVDDPGRLAAARAAARAAVDALLAWAGKDAANRAP